VFFFFSFPEMNPETTLKRVQDGVQDRGEKTFLIDE